MLDIAWLDPTGAEMTDETWNSPDVRALGVRLNGDAIQEVNERGERIVGDTLLLMLNAGDEPIAFVLPPTAADRALGHAARHRRPVAAVAAAARRRPLRAAGPLDGGPEAEQPQGRPAARRRLGTAGGRVSGCGLGMVWVECD